MLIELFITILTFWQNYKHFAVEYYWLLMSLILKKDIAKIITYWFLTFLFRNGKKKHFLKKKIVLLRGICTFITIYESYYFGDRTKWIRTKRGPPVLSSPCGLFGPTSICDLFGLIRAFLVLWGKLFENRKIWTAILIA